MRCLCAFVFLAFAVATSLGAAESHTLMREVRRGVLIEDLVFKTRLDDYTPAYRVCPAKGKPGQAPAILFVHWLDTSEPTSNRSQYLGEAVELARQGACALLVDTPWAGADWFPARDPAKDRRAVERQRDRLADALDFLLTSPAVDRNRVAYVGHDFGAMFGALLAASETRVHFWAFQAATPRWHEWFLLGRNNLDPAARQSAIDSTTDLDPIKALSKARGSFYFQFATIDRYVPRERAEEFFAAAPEPKKIAWYEAGHGLNPAARSDRVKWLAETLRLRRANAKKEGTSANQ